MDILGIIRGHIQKQLEQDNKHIEIPVETASLIKRLSSPGYLLLHPDKTWMAIIYNFVSSILYLIVVVAIVAWVLIEIVDSIYLLLYYGILH